MRRVIISNPILDPTFRTFLTSPYSTGTSLSVTSNNSFAPNDLLVVGEPKGESTEPARISSVTAATGLELAAMLKFPHSTDEPIYKTIWNYVYIESNHEVISQSLIQWDNSEGVTIYFDANGINTTEYRFRFYNSITGVYSDYSPTVTGDQLNKNSVGYMLSQVRRIINDPNGRLVSSDEIIRDFNEAQEIIYATNPRWWFLKFNDRSITTQADVAKYNLDLLGGGTALNPGITLGVPDRIKYNLNDGSQNFTYDLHYMSPVEFDQITVNVNRPKSNYAGFYTLEPPDSSSVNGYLRIEPVPTDAFGTIDFWGWKTMPLLNDVSDRTPVEIPSVIEEFAIGKSFAVLGNETKAQEYKDSFFGAAIIYRGRRIMSKLTGITLLENLNGKMIRPLGQPQQIKFRGRRKLYGVRNFDRDAFVELHIGD